MPKQHPPSPGATLRTQRLILRPLTADDRVPFAQMNADPAVVEFLHPPFTQSESDQLLDLLIRTHRERGYGIFALETPREPFVGIVGLAEPNFEAHFTPCVEMAWRLPQQHWGKGYATEAAQAVFQFAFTELHLKEVVAFTAVTNERSQAVMRRLSMTRDPREDFEHPSLPEGHALRPHVLYRKRLVA
jgi:RimJ/RimL family protein N-acetyltransferase